MYREEHVNDLIWNEIPRGEVTHFLDAKEWYE